MRATYAITSFILTFSFLLGVASNNDEHQSIYINALSVNEGLASNEVNCILQDSKGFMWFGTNNGLSRFDGYKFKNFKSNSVISKALNSNTILCLVEDHSDQLWIGTTMGLNKINLTTNTVDDCSCILSEKKTVNSIAVDNNNNIYLGTNGGLYCFNNSTHTVEKIETDMNGYKLYPDYLKTLYIDSKNYLWIGRWGGGYVVYNLNTNTFVEYPYLKEIKDLIINSIYEDSQNNIWLTTWDTHGVYRIENPHQPTRSKITNFQLEKMQKGTIYPVVYAVNQDSKTGNILLATSNGLVIVSQAYKYEGNVQLNDEKTTKIKKGEVFTFFKDRTGLIWYSIYGIGVNALTSNKPQFYQYNLSKHIEDNNLPTSITAIYEDENDIVWLGIKTYGLGLFSRKDKTLTLYNEHPVLKDISNEANSILCFHKVTAKNELWIGTRYDGLYKVSFDHDKKYTLHKISIPNIDAKNLSILSIIEDKQNARIWIGTNRGLESYQYNKQQNEYILADHKFLKDRFKGTNITTLLLDRDHTLWIGTKNQGLFKYYSKENKYFFKHYNYQNNLINNNDILCIFEDHKNTIWVGTKGGGLVYLDADNDMFQAAKTIHLMPDDAVYSMLEDNWGSLWLGTGNGLVYFNIELPLDEKIRNYAGDEGVRINSFNPNAAFINNKNELFFGASNGFITFIPKKQDNNSYAPKPVITDISISNIAFDKLPKDEKQAITTKQIYYSDKLNLAYNQNNIQIEFASLLFENNFAIKYAYMLDKIDKDWVYADSKNNVVNYINLQEGTYVFRVKSSNKDGIWCESSNNLIIQIAPPLWKTGYAIIIYIFIFSLIVFLILRFIWNQLKLKRMLAIEQIEREKSEEVHQAKMKFFTNISHEFFTPLTIIKCAIDNLINRNPEDAALMLPIQSNMNRLTKLLEQIIEFRKVETGNLKLKLSKLEFVSFIEDICKSNFALIASDKNIDLRFYSHIDKIEGYGDADKIEQILYNLLSNAIKYNLPDGFVEVVLSEINDKGYRKLVITVEDAGIGMNQKVQSSIFKRYYEGNFRNFKVKSIGLGLSLSYDLIKLHQGNISVESEEGVGTKFFITLPLDKDDYENQFDLAPEFTNNSEQLPPPPYIEFENTENTKPTLLLVEDNEELLATMSESMKEDFLVITATNGKEAIKIIEDKNIDIVVTDIFMPEMDGNELTKYIKTKVEFSHIPVIMLSAGLEVQNKVLGFESGADSYITKPFDTPALIANIKSLCRNRQLQAEAFALESTIFNISKYTHNNTDKDFLKNVLELINANLSNPEFTANDLYVATNMSQSTFYRKLQSLIGISPNDLIRKVKIDIACKLLMETNLNISQIAYDLGFNDPKYFSTVFKKITGLTPSDYVKQDNVVPDQDFVSNA